MYALAIHGGAGVIKKENLTSEQEKLYLQALEEALSSGYFILQNGGRAVEAVEAAVIKLEDNELFNAGKGSVFTSEGTHEMEASIMCGKSLDAGAVCGIKNVKNPISLAKVVMEKSKHLFLAGQGAEKFAKEAGLKSENDEYFFNQKRYDQLKEAQKNSRVQLDHYNDKKFGTVGAVAIDIEGNLAAATSTGGLTNKNYGRIGDSPVIGAGTYANNLACAISCTGDGEFFIRAVAAYDIYCLMSYKNLTLKEACQHVVHEKLRHLGGEGGVIAVDKNGNIEIIFNSEGMYRAYKKSGEDTVLGIFKNY